MGQATSVFPVSPGITQSVKATKLPNSNFPETEIGKNLKSAAELLQHYNNNDLRTLVDYIKSDKQLLNDLDINLDDPNSNPFKFINDYIQKFNKFGTNNNNESVTNLLKGSKFYDYLKEVEDKQYSETKQQILDSEIVKNSDQEKKQIEGIFDNISKVRAREQYFKYQYLLSQLWIIAYLNKINTAIGTFSNDTITTFEAYQSQRNDYVRNMLSTLLNILVMNENNITDADFKYFREAMVNLETEMNKNSIDLSNKLKKTSETLTQRTQLSTGQPNNFGQGQGQGGKNKNKQQKGGFVRNGSRFPQAFYDLSSE
jgi:hypothetical protein